MNKPCWVYMIECRGGGVYVGSAQDVPTRYTRHCAGIGSLYTRLNPPVRLLAYQEFSTRTVAMREEKRLKKLRFWEKLAWCQDLWRAGLENPFETAEGVCIVNGDDMGK